MAGSVVLNQPGVYLVDADGNVLTANTGTVISSHEGIIVAGSDGTTLRFMKVAADGTLRIDPTGTTPQPITDNGGSLTIDNSNIDAALSTLATESKLEAVRVLLASLDGKDYATETKLEAVRVLLASLDGKDYATQATLNDLLTAFGQGAVPTADTLQARTQELIDNIGSGATPAVDTLQARTQELIDNIGSGASPTADTLQARTQELIDNIGSGASPTADTLQARTQELIDNIGEGASPTADTLQARVQELIDNIGEGATPTVDTLQARTQELIDNIGSGASPIADTLQARMQELIDLLTLVKDTDGVKKITDQLPAGVNEIGAVKQGTKAANADAWPHVQVDSSGNPVTVTLDAGVYRQEIQGKVSVTGAVPPPATTRVDIFADNPLTVGNHDTTFTIPDGQTFHLQEVTAGNEDPTKGSRVDIIFDDGTEHVIARIYTNGETVAIGFTDLTKARDGTALLGNGAGTSDIIVRRTKFAGTDIAIDATVTGYY